MAKAEQATATDSDETKTVEQGEKLTVEEVPRLGDVTVWWDDDTVMVDANGDDAKDGRRRWSPNGALLSVRSCKPTLLETPRNPDEDRLAKVEAYISTVERVAESVKDALSCPSCDLIPDWDTDEDALTCDYCGYRTRVSEGNSIREVLRDS